MEAAEDELRKVLAGKPVPTNAADSQFFRKDALQFIPKTKETVGYIVAVILFNDLGQVLLVQEAKRSCYGMWYLPAGRLEPAENLAEGAQREVKEEAGLDCIVTTLLSVNFDRAHWIRFAFTGNITGGTLKTLAEQDKESLQADFFDIDSIKNEKLRLRAKDIISLISQAAEYRKSLTSVPHHPPQLPVVAPHTHLLHRPVIVVLNKDNKGSLHILINGTGPGHFPVSAIAEDDNTLFDTLLDILRRALSNHTLDVLSSHLYGVLSIEHSGTGSSHHDGVCITTLVQLNLSLGSSLPHIHNSFQWLPLTDQHLIDCLQKKLDGQILTLIQRR